MKAKEMGTLGSIVIIGMLVVIPLQQYLLASPDTIASLGIRDQQKFWSSAVLPTLTYGIWIIGVLATLLWIGLASKSSYRSSKSAFAMRGTWWLYAAGIYILYLIIFLLLAYSGSGTVAMELQMLLLVLVFPIDIIVLFWLPTAMSTPGTLRNVPPMAMTIRKQFGG